MRIIKDMTYPSLPNYLLLTLKTHQNNQPFTTQVSNHEGYERLDKSPITLLELAWSRTRYWKMTVHKSDVQDLTPICSKE